jgi:hypothetical protein
MSQTTEVKRKEMESAASDLIYGCSRFESVAAAAREIEVPRSTLRCVIQKLKNKIRTDCLIDLRRNLAEAKKENEFLRKELERSWYYRSRLQSIPEGD